MTTIGSLVSLIVAPESSSFIVIMAITCVSSFCLMIAFAPGASNTIFCSALGFMPTALGCKLTIYYMIDTMVVAIALCGVFIVMKRKGSISQQKKA